MLVLLCFIFFFFECCCDFIRLFCFVLFFVVFFIEDVSWLAESDRLRILSRCVEKIGKAYNDKIQKDDKWSLSQFWNAMETKATTLVQKYLDREMQRQKAYRKHQRDNNNNGKTNRIGQNNTAS